ncbi:quinon protein alcohol dehydrogenase-like superfamily [Chaetomium sp. MPI-CAGE-AT-0009]|nr:quinon protein alcohol dehydrogenase-like superfamily [Chaetomium sp. MPI-CAGE-AT-0009]
MASTPSNRTKPTPSNSPFISRPSRSSIRPRAFYESCLSLQRVVGTTCASPTGFDTVHSSFAYLAGGAVVVVDVSGEHYAQRFYRARPTAIPLLSVSPTTNTSSTPIPTPKANDSRNRASASSPRDSLHADWPDSPTSKTWTSRERIKAATCLALSRDGRYLAVGETGYAPRVLLFNLQDASSDVPLVAISEHTFGVKAVAWSPDTKYLASLGAANDGFLYLWKVDSRTGAVKLFQQNKCTAFVKGMVWMGSSVITLGVRHVKVWRVEEGLDAAPVKTKFSNEGAAPTPLPAQKPLPGRNILLGSMLDETFSCAFPISDEKAIICSETGSVCLLDDTNKQMKLSKVAEVDFSITCVSRRGEDIHVGGKDGQLAVISLDDLLSGISEPTIRSSEMAVGLVAMGFLAENLVTIDTRRSIDIWSADYTPGSSIDDKSHIPIPGLGDPIVGVDTGAESGPPNQVVVVRATNDGALFIAGDKLGVLRIVEVSTGECLLETKVHSSNCQDITVHEGKSRFVVASCGRDRTVQLFHRTSAGVFEHFQTLEFSAKVVQVLIPNEDKVLTCSLDRTLQIHELVNKEGEPDVMAAIPFKSISLKASPSSMAVTTDEKAVFVSLLDRSVCQYDFTSGRVLGSFKCNDEAGLDSVVLESLTHTQPGPNDPPFLLGISNTDKSVRVYDTQAGCFMDREWGHTEAINGAVLIDNEESGRKVVSVGEDGTIMIWALDFDESSNGSQSRSPSPEKTPQPASTRPPLRRVLSKAELAEFQRPSSAAGPPSGSTPRRTSPRPSHRRPAKFQLPFSSLRTPSNNNNNTPEKPATSPTNTTGMIIIDDTHARTPSRRPSSGAGSRCSDDSPPPESPKTRSKRRPSLPALGATPLTAAKSRKNSSSNQRGSGGSGNGGGNGYGFGTLSMATEQTCRQLRAYRRKLASADSIHADVLAQLDAELRLTAAALGERAIRSRTGSGNRGHGDRRGEAGGGSLGGGGSGGGGGGGGGNEVSETVLSGLLDQYSERLVSMLDEKLRLRLTEEEKDSLAARERPRTADDGSNASSSGASIGEGPVCEEPESL